jgi:hypothetical protein
VRRLPTAETLCENDKRELGKLRSTPAIFKIHRSHADPPHPTGQPRLPPTPVSALRSSVASWATPRPCVSTPRVSVAPGMTVVETSISTPTKSSPMSSSLRSNLRAKTRSLCHHYAAVTVSSWKWHSAMPCRVRRGALQRAIISMHLARTVAGWPA